VQRDRRVVTRKSSPSRNYPTELVDPGGAVPRKSLFWANSGLVMIPYNPLVPGVQEAVSARAV
jgi:hypothetical protein